MNRRKALFGFGATALIGIAAPAIVRASSLMKIAAPKIIDGHYGMIYNSDRSLVFNLATGELRMTSTIEFDDAKA